MEVNVAKSAGFCFGVKRAMEKVAEQIDSKEQKKAAKAQKKAAKSATSEAGNNTTESDS